MRFFSAKVCFLFFLIIGCISLLSSDVSPNHDQLFIKYSFQELVYPHWESGITSCLIAGIVNVFTNGSLDISNRIIRVFAFFLYMYSGYLLLKTDKNTKLFYLFFLLLFTSRFPFLWLSSELFAGAFLAFSLYILIKNKRLFFFQIFMALASFSKPDLLVPGFITGIFILFQKAKNRLMACMFFLTLFMVILAPNLVGRTQFQGARALQSFQDHYIMLYYKNLTWEEGGEKYHHLPVSKLKHFYEIPVKYPFEYLGFLFKSIIRTVVNLFYSNLLFLLPLVLLSFFFSNFKTEKIFFGFFLLNLSVIIAFSFLHIRYQARFYPLFLFLNFRVLNKHIVPYRKGYIASLTLILFFQIWQSFPVIHYGVWWPD